MLVVFTAEEGEREEGEGEGEREEGEDGEGEEEEMERMLNELTLISPPNTSPLREEEEEAEGENRRQDEENESSTTSSLDTLTQMRLRLLETIEEDKINHTPSNTTPSKTLPTALPNNETSEEIATNRPPLTSLSSSAINIEPSTPTSETMATNIVDSVITANSGSDGSLQLGHSYDEDNLLPSTTGCRGDGREMSPCFSPASLQNSPGDTVVSGLMCVCVCVCVLSLSPLLLSSVG